MAGAGQGRSRRNSKWKEESLALHMCYCNGPSSFDTRLPCHGTCPVYALRYALVPSCRS